jgi:hypothetical protein
MPLGILTFGSGVEHHPMQNVENLGEGVVETMVFAPFLLQGDAVLGEQRGAALKLIRHERGA